MTAATALALLLHGIWALFLAHDAGDLAAQYAWTDFARQHPAAAYNLSWYGGMHTASYSMISPYLMGWLGVRTAGVVAGTAAAAITARLLIHARVARPLLPALWTAVALWCNVASGRVTFAIGVAFGLAALVPLFPAADLGAATAPGAGPAARRVRAGSVLALAAAATIGSPLAGLFLGVVATALLLTGRGRDACLLAAGPATVLVVSALLFPFEGEQPFDWYVAVVLVASAAAVRLCAPPHWRTVRAGAPVYAAGVALTWAVPSPVGSNVERLTLLFGGTVLLAAALGCTAGRPGPAGAGRTGGRRAGVRGRRGPRQRPGPAGPVGPAGAPRRGLAAGAAFLAVAGWQLGKPAGDLVTSVPVSATARDTAPLIAELRRIGADRGRVEVVPLRTHLEASGFAPYVNLARGWNRQADVSRNPLFYTGTLTADAYRDWLRHWGVGYVVLPVDPPDDAAVDEARIVAAGHPWLSPVWQDARWRLFRVAGSPPLADPPATVRKAGPAALTVDVAGAGPVLLRVPWSPWLGVVGPAGGGRGCLAEAGEWTMLYAPGPGTYRVAGRYGLPRGNRCPAA
ncbi:MFS transporter [Kitasatospora sp. NBC_00240]|uniref:MFS transporter n=1 Tax=Kitasatospora sp. NBC_00240 TaxID=2903567 RepID=UPI00224D6704|nr:MFS transporter [Kitasatospora sp. NBC_00240]MCX5214220.1 MFS transporter [Kitasatospora sp. NBC_00240]